MNWRRKAIKIVLVSSQHPSCFGIIFYPFIIICFKLCGLTYSYCMDGKSGALQRYYSIGEVSKILRVNSSALRYWEKQFKEIRPLIKNKRRMYTIDDITKIKSIITLIKERCYTINGARNNIKKETKSKSRLLHDLKSVKTILVSMGKTFKKTLS